VGRADSPCSIERVSTDNAVILWDDAALQAVRRTIPAPTVVSRAVAVLHTSMFDAWAAYDTTAVPTVMRRGWRRPAAERTAANKSQAVSFAAYRTLVDLFPATKTVFDTLMTQLGYAASNTTMDTGTPAGVGNAAAAAVLDYRHRDGSNQLGDLHAGAYSDYTGYQAVNTSTTIVDPNRWQPLFVSNPQGGFTTQVYTTPQWGLDPLRPDLRLGAPARTARAPPFRGVHEPGGGARRDQRRPDRRSEGDRGVLRRRSDLRVSAGALGDLRAVRFPPRRPHARRRRQDVLCAGQRPARRRDQRLGREALLRFRAAVDRDPLPLRPARPT
jgi:hypothetical protein